MEGITYGRAMILLQNCLSYLVGDTCELMYALEEAREIGFSDDEIKSLGFEFMLDVEGD